MSNLFWGFFFIAFNFNLTLGNAVIGLIPDFIGYSLILKGIIELQDSAIHFKKIKDLVVLMVFVKIITYFMDLLGMTAQIQTGAVIVGLVLLVISLYIEYSIICGIQEMEKSQYVNLNAEKLFSLWKIVAIFSALAYIGLILPSLSFVFILISAIANIVFLYNLYQSKKAYEQKE